MVPFVVVGSVGLVILLASLVFGEVFDLLDGAITGAGLGGGMAVFGAVGAVVTVNDGPVWLTYVLSGVVGLAVLAGVPLAERALHRSEDGTPYSPVGLYGTARSTITAASGEVSLDGPHEMETRMAFADYQIATGTRVRVVDLQGTRVKVEQAGPTDAPGDPDEPPR
ncbi:MAG: NfeD family protein [Cellulomonas sp.]|jgi:membrane protein implicated in regulation of membrane protease activity|nr:NfeD family protein [Cellulomonas sp.]